MPRPSIHGVPARIIEPGQSSRRASPRPGSPRARAADGGPARAEVGVRRQASRASTTAGSACSIAHAQRRDAPASGLSKSAPEPASAAADRDVAVLRGAVRGRAAEVALRVWIGARP